MTDQQHPITPSPELMEAWSLELDLSRPTFAQVAVMAARWGADQELEACCAYLAKAGLTGDACGLQLTRRPKPPSLKEQALLAIDTAVADGRLSSAVSNVVRRALEQLDD
jgi:hypothetical protein